MAEANEHGSESLVLRMLRDLARKPDVIIHDLRDLKSRTTALEAFVRSSVTVINGRLDCIETRLDRIERRELPEHT